MVENKYNGLDLTKIKLGLELCGKYQNNTASEYLYNLVLKQHDNNKLSNLLDSDEFYKLLYAALDSWDMNSRGAKLVDLNDFINNIKKHKNIFLELDKYDLSCISKEELTNLLGSKIKTLYNGIKILNSRQKINNNHEDSFVKDPLVVDSKLFHFILPKLFVPMDRKYTMDFFYNNGETSYNKFKKVFLYNMEFLDNYNKENNLLDIYKPRFRYKLYPSKLLDNVIIGLYKK